MIAYKWVIKKNNQFHPIINNGAYSPFDGLNLRHYEKRKTIHGFINPWILTNRVKSEPLMANSFHRTGFHFWIKKRNPNRLKSFNNCMKRYKKKINCVLTCFISKKDIILQDNKRLIASQFKILKESKI